MRLKLATIVCAFLFLCGCKNTDADMERALSLRNKLTTAEAYSFQAKITADYGEAVYSFTLDCQFDQTGDMSFCVVEPKVIRGIKGVISDHTGKLTFEDQIIAFQTMADGQITPVMAPWLFIRTLRSGYIDGCSDENGFLYISADDSYEEDALHLNIWVDAALIPQKGEIFWQGRRVLAIVVEEFTYL